MKSIQVHCILVDTHTEHQFILLLSIKAPRRTIQMSGKTNKWLCVTLRISCSYLIWKNASSSMNPSYIIGYWYIIYIFPLSLSLRYFKKLDSTHIIPNENEKLLFQKLNKVLINVFTPIFCFVHLKTVNSVSSCMLLQEIQL